jgi:ADP-heptose:LPS heptosyltransferase
MYTQAVARPRQLRPRHSVENQWDLLAALGIGAPERTLDSVEMPERADVRARVDARLQSNGIGADTPLVVMHVSAGNPFRRWPVDRFAAVAARLVQDDPSRVVVLTSGPSEAGAADEAAREAQQQLPSGLASRIARCGEFDLAELRALVGRAALYIGGDSGPLHIAGTTRAPVVGLYGPTLPVRSAPWRDPAIASEAVERADLACRPCDQRQCVHSDFRCLTSLTADSVVAAAERAMSRSSSPSGRVNPGGPAISARDPEAPRMAHFGTRS